jgi:hypothetical protein
MRIRGIETGRTTKTAPIEARRDAKRYPITLKGVLRHALYIPLIERIEER